MIFGNYNEINYILDQEINKIFLNYIINELSQIEKRKIIYDYCVKEIMYDENKLNEIKFNNMRIGITKYERNPYLELESVIKRKKGVCNAISQYYKLLLEKVGIYAYCINCIVLHDGEKMGHQLNLVYNDDNTFSFDDVTYAIIDKNKKTNNNYFNFDITEAKNKRQKYGIIPIYNNCNWIILSEQYINKIIGRNVIKNNYINNLENININDENFKSNNIVIKKLRIR